MTKRVFPKAYQNLIDSILYTRRRLGKKSIETNKHFNRQSRKHVTRHRPRHRLTKRCTRR